MELPFDRCWHLTWTTYGTWLPGDERGFVGAVRDAGGDWETHNIPGTDYDRDMPGLVARAKERLKSTPIFLDVAHAKVLFAQFQETATHRGWHLLAVAIMRAHIHVLAGVQGDTKHETVLRDFKGYGSGSLNRRWSKPVSGTWWTASGSKRKKGDDDAIVTAIRYIANQQNSLTVWVHPDWRWCLS